MQKILTLWITAGFLLAGCIGAPRKDTVAADAAGAAQASEAGRAESASVGVEPAVDPARPSSVFAGSGTLVGVPAEPASRAPAAGEGIQLSFVDTEIATVVGSVLGEGLGAAYVVDPSVKGTMSLQSSRPLARNELVPALEAALRLHDVALTLVDGTYRIVPLKDALRQAGALRVVSGRPGFGIQIVPLRYVSALDIQKLIEPLVPQGSILRVDEARNLLLVAGSSQEIATVLDAVATFDVDWLSGMSFAIFNLTYVDAQTLTTELNEIFGNPKSPLAGLVRLVPIPRLNAVLTITPQARYLTDVETWIKRLDLGGSSPGRRIYVYDVQNGKAGDLSSSLSRILSLSGAEDTPSPAGATATPTANSLTSQAPRPYVTSPPSESMGQTALDSGALKIVPNEENNSLLILATPSEFGVIEQALLRLDVLPRQVLIEASLAEVTLTDDLKYGIQWSYLSGDGTVTLSESPTGAVSQRFPGFSYLFTGREDIRAVLNAIESVTDVNVISSPKLMVLNNREASLQIGDQVPIAVQSAVGVDTPDAPIVNAVQLKDTGVILRVTPRVNKSGLVILDIAQEVSDVVPTTTSGIDSPTIQQRKLTSTVAVRSGETIALGGLIRERTSKSRSGVPFLSKIPGFGALFRSTNDIKSRTELIVLITPRVLRDNTEFEDVMQGLQDKFSKLTRAFPEPQAP